MLLFNQILIEKNSYQQTHKQVYRDNNHIKQRIHPEADGLIRDITLTPKGLSQTNCDKFWSF